MNKQIEEMARIICAPTANKGKCEKCGFKMQCSKFDEATDIYNAGYRKASEVAREVIQEVRNAWANSWTESEFLEMLKDIEKKYEVTDE